MTGAGRSQVAHLLTPRPFFFGLHRGNRSMPKQPVMSLDELPALMTMRDLEQVLRLSRQTTWNLVRAPGFPLIELGNPRRLRVRKDDFLEWLETKRGAAVLAKAEEAP